MAFTEANLAREKNIADLSTAKRSQDQEMWRDLNNTLTDLAALRQRQREFKTGSDQWSQEFGFQGDEFQYGKDKDAADRAWDKEKFYAGLAAGDKELANRLAIAGMGRGDLGEKQPLDYALDAWELALSQSQAGSFYDGTIKYDYINKNKEEMLQKWEDDYRWFLQSQLNLPQNDVNMYIDRARPMIDRFFTEQMQVSDAVSPNGVTEAERDLYNRLMSFYPQMEGNEKYFANSFKRMIEQKGETSPEKMQDINKYVQEFESWQKGTGNPAQPTTPQYTQPESQGEQLVYNEINKIIGKLSLQNQGQAQSYLAEISQPGALDQQRLNQILAWIQTVTPRSRPKEDNTLILQ